MTLTKKQSELLGLLYDKQHTEILFGGGAGGAKSFGGCYWLIRMCQKYPGTRWLMGRSELKTLKETTLNTFFEVANMVGLTSKMFTYNQQSGTIIFPFWGGSQIILKDLKQYPSDPNFDSLGSLEITGAFIDECNQIAEKAWNIVKSRIRYKLDQYELVPKILGTCNPSKNWVYTRFYKPWKDKLLPIYMVFLQSLLTDNPFISKHYKENLQSLDKVSRERLEKGNWEYDDNPYALIPYEAITDLFVNRFDNKGDKFISCDVARFGEDKTVICLWNGLHCYEILTYDKTSTTDVVQKLKSLSKAHNVSRSNIVVDEDGVGGGVVDQLEGCQGFINNSKPISGNYANLKTQSYYELADAIKKHLVTVSCSRDIQALLIEELEQVIAKDVDKDQRLRILSKKEVKENIGRSPDISDGLMMRMYYELAQTPWAL